MLNSTATPLIGLNSLARGFGAAGAAFAIGGCISSAQCRNDAKAGLAKFAKAVETGAVIIYQALTLTNVFSESKTDQGADGANAQPNNGANSGDKDPSTPTGQRGSPIEVKPGTNEPTSIGGRDYSGHALDRMQGRGVPPSAVEDAIQNGTQSPGNTPGTTVHTGSNGVTVVTGNGGRVVTVIPR